MPEDLAGLDVLETPASDASDTADGGAPVETPVAQPTDIEKVRADVDERIKGFQRLVAERDAELSRLREQDEERRIASLPDDERSVYERERTNKEIERLLLENEVLRLSQKYPSVADKYDALMKSADAEEQMKLLVSWASPVGTPSPADAEADAPASVDKNNPVRQRKQMVDGYEMDDNIAMSILKNTLRWPRG